MAHRKIFGGAEFLIVDTRPGDIFIPEEMTREHQMIYTAATDFVKKEILSNLEGVEKKDEATVRALMKKSGDLGLNAIDIAEAYGGEDMDKISACLVTDAIGGAASFAVSHSAHTGIGTLPIVYFGTEDQKKKYLPKLATGEWIAAYCLTEANAGSDALNAQTTATLSENSDYYLLNGEKIFITNGAWANLFIVYAKVDGEKFTGFIVERDFPGVTSGAEEEKLGIKGSSTTSVILKDCRVPLENVLFEIGQGHKIAFNILNIGRYKLCASCTGGSKRIIAEAVRYATAREQFGRKICSFGMIQTKLADMCISIYMAESLTYRIAAMIEDKLSSLDNEARQQGAENAKAIEEYAVECSIAKVFGSECLDFCADEVVQIHGGYGYIAEYPAERMYRDARINRIFEGTNEINRLLIPGTLLKRAMQNRLALFDSMQALDKTLQTDLPDPTALDRGPLAIQKHLVASSKKVFLLAAGRAAAKLLTQLADEQEVLAFMADMAIEIFAMESGLLRAQKYMDLKGEAKAEYHAAAIQVYVNDTIPKIDHWARQILAFVETGDALARQLSLVDKLLAHQPWDTVRLRRLLAEKVVKGKRYPF